MKNLEKRVIERLDSEKNKKRYNFTLSPKVKAALSLWCKENGRKESPVIEAMLIEMIPKRLLK